MPSPPPEADPPSQPINHPPQPPGPAEVQPTALAPQTGDDLEDTSGWRCYGPLPLLNDDPLFHAQRANRCVTLARRQGITPDVSTCAASVRSPPATTSCMIHGHDLWEEVAAESSCTTAVPTSGNQRYAISAGTGVIR